MPLPFISKKVLIPCFIALITSACSFAPDAQCSREEAQANLPKCPIPAPPLTQKAQTAVEDSEEKTRESRYSTTADLDIAQKKRREEILKRISELKEKAARIQSNNSNAETITATSEQNLVSSGGFTVQLGAFRSPKSQEELLRDLKQPNLYSFQLSNGLWAVSTGMFSSLEESAEHAKKLRAEGFRDAYATKLPEGASYISEPR